MEGDHVSLTIFHLCAELALFGILKDRVVARICAFHSPITTGLVKEGTISTGRSAANRVVTTWSPSLLTMLTSLHPCRAQRWLWSKPGALPALAMGQGGRVCGSRGWATG